MIRIVLTALVALTLPAAAQPLPQPKVGQRRLLRADVRPGAGGGAKAARAGSVRADSPPKRTTASRCEGAERALRAAAPVTF